MFNICEYVQSECKWSIDLAKQIYNIDTIGLYYKNDGHY